MIQLRSVCLSGHLDSFCRKLNELRGVEFVYESCDPGAMRRRIGWSMGATYKNEVINASNTERAKKCDLLIEMLREFDIMEYRACTGRKTIYMSERWFKPIPLISFTLFNRVLMLRLPGVIRLLVPSYRRMVRRFVRLMDNENFYVLPIGVHSVIDFVRMYGVLHGKLRWLLWKPHVEIVRCLGGSVKGFPRMKVWGYFVESSNVERPETSKDLKDCSLRVLWVGRMVDWKRVDVLIKAFKEIKRNRSIALQICGEGPLVAFLRRLAGDDCVEGVQWQAGKISFSGYVTQDKVRSLMRQASVYVMPSNAEEGWGAAVSEALSEGCSVISTFEAGSSATLLPNENLYHSHSVQELVYRLESFHGDAVESVADYWDGENAARKLIELCG